MWKFGLGLKAKRFAFGSFHLILRWELLETESRFCVPVHGTAMN